MIASFEEIFPELKGPISFWSDNPTVLLTLLQLLWNERNRRGDHLSYKTVWYGASKRQHCVYEGCESVCVCQWTMQKIHWRRNYVESVLFSRTSAASSFSSRIVRLWREAYGFLKTSKTSMIMNRQPLFGLKSPYLKQLSHLSDLNRKRWK